MSVVILLVMPLILVQDTQPQVPISTPDEIAQDFTQVPCTNKERLNGAKSLFEKMQAPSWLISVAKLNGVENLVVRQPGSSDEIIVMGAHYDFAERGCGAVDNWSGVVALAHLYRTIRTLKTQKTVLFVAFGKEEKGLIGSKAMVQAIPKDQISTYCAMINIDSFGLAAPFALEGMSSKPLIELAQAASNEMHIPFAKVRIKGADSDSTSFLRKNVPAVTLSGLSADWESILHTPFDQANKVNPNSVYAGYRLALTMWTHLDQADCRAFH
jgi:Zn-dependent M28 family amino/carboxypeptidase